MELWAKEAQSKISELMNPGLLSHFGKKNMRSLTSEEFSQAETIKFGILYNLSAFEVIDEQSISLALTKKLTDGVITKCNEWISNAAVDINRKLSIEEIRNIRVSFYAEQYAEGPSTSRGEL
jgi:predicted DNA-binding helix-hairpin-helix protein